MERTAFRIPQGGFEVHGLEWWRGQCAQKGKPSTSTPGVHLRRETLSGTTSVRHLAVGVSAHVHIALSALKNPICLYL